MKIAIVKYNAGNVESVKNSLNRLEIIERAQRERGEHNPFGRFISFLELG